MDECRRAANRRRNWRRSRRKLEKLLALNFPDGGTLVTLTYAPGGYIPAGAYAEDDLYHWLGRCRARLGGAFPYIRGSAAGPDGATVHRIFMPIEREQAAELAGVWTYGPAAAELISRERLDDAEELLDPADGRERGRRSWTASSRIDREEGRGSAWQKS